MLRNIKVFFVDVCLGDILDRAIGREKHRNGTVYYFSKGIRTGFTSPSDCVWLVP